MSKASASASDMEDKPISFTEIGDGLYAFTAEGDPNSGVIIGDRQADQPSGSDTLSRRPRTRCIGLWG